MNVIKDFIIIIGETIIMIFHVNLKGEFYEVYL